MTSAAFRIAFRTAAVAAIAAALAACQTTAAKKPFKPMPSVSIGEPSKASGWQAVANPIDESRVVRVNAAWTGGLAEARSSAAGREAVKEEGALLDPKAALARPDPTPGSYKCRQLTLAKANEKGPGIERFKPFFCYVEVDGDQLTIVKQTGSKRPAGRLWEDDDPRRMIFLGSLALGSEEEARAYGEDPKRDVSGVFQRVGPFRWRLVLPFPREGGSLDVIELTPVADQPG